MRSHADLPTQDLAGILSRLTKALDRWPALPVASLHYRLGEVGRERIEPRRLARALSEVANNPHPRKQLTAGPWQPRPDIFVTAREPSRIASVIGAHAAEDVALIREADHPRVFDELVRVVVETLCPGDDRPTVTHAESNDEPKVSQTLIIPRMVISDETTATVLVTHSLDNLYPDHPLLWRALAEASANDQRLLVVARLITPVTFPLFKALGIQGAQFYSMLTLDERYSEISSVAARIGWPHVRPIRELRSHRFLQNIQAAAARIIDSPTVELAANKLVREGLSRGFAEKRDPTAWTEWAESAAAQLNLSDGWLSTTRLWKAWSAFRNSPHKFPEQDTPAMLLPTEDDDARLAQRSENQPVDLYAPPEQENAGETAAGHERQTPFGRPTEITRQRVAAKLHRL